MAVEPRQGTGTTGDGPQDGRRRVVVGLVADPGLPSALATRLRGSLEVELARHVDATVDWEVRTQVETLPLNSDGEIQLVQGGRRLCDREGWDYLVCLTELPRHVGTRPLLYDVSATVGSGLVSLPALGPFRMRKRACRAAVDVLAGLYAERPGPVEATGALGRVRLLAGMLRTNRPWRLVPSLSRALAAAAATAAFGIFYSSIWSMADALSPWRLAGISLLAVGAMATWLVLQNDLWERPESEHGRRRAVLYNAATALTLLVGVACMYLLLFVMTLVAGLAVIDASYLQQMLGHPVGPSDYVTLTWLATSMGIVAGAVGSSVEGEAAVRQATYGRRELERQARTDEDDATEAEEAYEQEAADGHAVAGESAHESPRGTDEPLRGGR